MRIGLERLLENPRRWLARGKVGLVANPTSVNRQLAHAADLLHAHPEVDLRLLFGPEHGLRGAAQDMVAVEAERDQTTGLPVVSLYGSAESSLAPAAEHLAHIDVLVFDVQDIGSRYYTYAATMALCMREAAKAKVKVVVLDRPNPIGGVAVEGGTVRAGYESFVGLYPVPQRHGMTVGELARLLNTTFSIGCELEVIACEGWQRRAYLNDTGLPWVLPSPNMPTLNTALVYPGMCLLEGTEASEGRGTTRPFEIFGAPYVDGRALAAELEKVELAGVLLRPCTFIPTFHKLAGQVCGGLQLHVVDRSVFEPYRTGLAVLWALRRLWPKQFVWRQRPYEFRSDALAIDLLTGDPAVREAIDAGRELEAVIRVASEKDGRYLGGREKALLYG